MKYNLRLNDSQSDPLAVIIVEADSFEEAEMKAFRRYLDSSVFGIHFIQLEDDEVEEDIEYGYNNSYSDFIAIDINGEEIRPEESTLEEERSETEKRFLLLPEEIQKKIKKSMIEGKLTLEEWEKFMK